MAGAVRDGGCRRPDGCTDEVGVGGVERDGGWWRIWDFFEVGVGVGAAWSWMEDGDSLEGELSRWVVEVAGWLVRCGTEAGGGLMDAPR